MKVNDTGKNMIERKRWKLRLTCVSNFSLQILIYVLVKYRYSFLYDEKAQHFMRKLTFFITLFVLRLGGYFLLKKKD